MNSELPFVDRCRAYLNEGCLFIESLFAEGNAEDVLGDDLDHIKVSLRDCLASKIKTYHYVLPTQVLCKVIDFSLDAHSLQAGWDRPGAFDARTIAHDVVVPFDRSNNRVLGGSPEPYVNNPLRCPAVSAEYRSQQKNKTDWDKLVTVLDWVEEQQDQATVESLFDQILIEIYRLLENVSVVYPTPNRISLKRTHTLIGDYLTEKSGGDRMEAVCTALFQTIGDEFGIFDEVKRERVNAADTVSGMSADIECWLTGRAILLVEVKDGTLTLTQIDSKLDTARAQRISEVLFIAQRGTDSANGEAIDERIDSEFVSGQNVYVSNFFDFSLGILILLGEQGRVEFLRKIGQELDRSNSAIAHRRAWAELLKQT